MIRMRCDISTSVQSAASSTELIDESWDESASSGLRASTCAVGRPLNIAKVPGTTS